MAQESAPQPLTLQLDRFEYRRIYSIDQLAQTFSARVFILLQIPAKEVEARKETRFPLGDTDDGDEDKLRFKSARWYLSMLHIHNMAEGGSVQTNVVTGADGGLECSMLVSGTFHVMFELREFPLDRQFLYVHLQSLCANEKKVPVRLEVPSRDGLRRERSASSTQRRSASTVCVDAENFALSNVWRLRQKVAVENRPINMQELGLSYPGLRFVLCVHRRPGYYIVNIVMPTGLIVLLTGAQFQIAAEDVADRLSVSVTLLLTAVAFKLVTSTMTPAVAYLTLLDRYVGVSSIIIFLAVGAAAVAGEINATFDRAAAWSLLGLWAVLHFWFAARVLAAQAGYSAHSRRPASVRNSVRC